MIKGNNKMPQWAKTPLDYRGTGVISSCEMLNIGAGNQIQVLCNSTTCYPWYNL